MSTVLLIIQLIISIVLTGLILIQRSEGGALGIGGGGGGGGGFMSGKSAANSVSRMTGILGGAFIINCLLLSIVFNKENQNKSLLDDSIAVESLTIDTESGDTQNPSATDNLTPETDLSETLSREETEPTSALENDAAAPEQPVKTPETP